MGYFWVKRGKCRLNCVAVAPWILFVITTMTRAEVVLDENFGTATGTYDASSGVWTSAASGAHWTSQQGTAAFGTAFTAYTGAAPASPPAIGQPVVSSVTPLPGPNIFVANPPNGSYALATYQTTPGNNATTVYGKINSPSFAVTPGDYYKVTYSTISAPTLHSGGAGEFAMGYANSNTAPVYGLWWPYDHPDYARPGEMTADATAILPSATFTTQTYFSRAPVNAATGYARFQAQSADIKVQSVTVTHVTDLGAVATWADDVFNEMRTTRSMPALNYTPPADRVANLSRTIPMLQSGKTVNVVMLGDSLMQDTANSAFDALVARFYNNGATLNVIPAVGSGTSIGAWNDPNNTKGLDLTHAVIDQKPDLVIIGGISNSGVTNATFNDLITKIRAQVSGAFGYTPDILLMSGPTFDPTEGTEITLAQNNGAWSSTIALTDITSYRGRLQNVIATGNNTAFMDMTGVWGQYLRDANAAGADLADLYRDGSIHTSTYGKDILGRSLASFLEAAPLPEPGALAIFGMVAGTCGLRRRRH